MPTPSGRAPPVTTAADDDEFVFARGEIACHVQCWGVAAAAADVGKGRGGRMEGVGGGEQVGVDHFGVP